MSQFVRICPRCQTQNPEYEHICTSCGQFIAMESAVSVENKPVQAEKNTPEETATEQPATASTTTEPLTDKSATPAIYLELQAANRPLFTVKSGWIMGQAHPDNRAEIQIPNTIADSQFVHRCHCRFVYKDNNWYVQALDQKRYQGQFTNLTFVNDMPINPDKARQIKNGDILRLSGLYFQVKFIT
jgi:pSer/pThr/pTyr-binding forkhead associated (FHA) protein